MNHTLSIKNEIKGKVIFLEPYCSALILSGIDLALQLREKNCDIYFCNISSGLPSSDTSRPVSKFLGSTEKYYWKQLSELILKESFYILDIPSLNKKINKDCYLFGSNWPSNKINLKEYTYKGKNLGLSVKSSLITLKSDPRIEELRFKKLVQKKLISSALIYERAKFLILKEKPDWVIYFNGRGATSYPTELACQEFAKNFATRENHFMADGKNLSVRKEKIILSKQKIHDPNTHRRKLDEASVGVSREKLERNASDFYQLTNDPNTADFTSQLIKNYSSFKKSSKKLAVYFHSSDDEVAAISLSKPKLFPLQVDAVIALDKVFARLSKEWDFVIRIHPRMSFKNTKEAKYWNNLELSVGKIIPSHDKTHSGEIISQADLVLAYDTSLITTCNYVRKPLVLLGSNSPFWGKGFGFEPKNKSDLFEVIIESQKKPPLSNLPSLKYAYWKVTDGIDLIYTKMLPYPAKNHPPIFLIKEKYKICEASFFHSLILKIIKNINKFKKFFLNIIKN